MQSNPTQKCIKCNKDISQSNFIIHQARCKGIAQSFIFTNTNTKPKQKLISKYNNIPKKQIQQINQKFPCSQCGYQMSITQLDSHPKQCKVKISVCKYCSEQFPQELIQEHFQFCEKKKNTGYVPNYQDFQFDDERYFQQQQERPQNIQQPEEQQQAQEDLGPPVSVTKRTIINNGNQTKIELVTYRNGVTIQKRYDSNNVLIHQSRLQNNPNNHFHHHHHHQHNPGFMFPNIQFNFGGRRLESGRNQTQFFQQMIQNLMRQMGVNRNLNPGMNKQQIKKVLKKVKFDKNTNGKQCSNCTICVTDYQQGENVVQLPCGHLFNEQCIIPWLKSSSVCPNCRKSLSMDNGRMGQQQNEFRV